VTASQLPAILVLDDDEDVCRMLARVLEQAGYRTASAFHPLDARALLAERSFALAICDLGLPGESGESIVRHIATAYPMTAILVVSAGPDHATAEQLTALGVYGYLIKPFVIDQLLLAVANALRRRELEQERSLYERALERAVTDRTAQLATSRRETIRRLAAAVEFRDGLTGRHSERTAHFAATIAHRLGLPASTCELLALAAPLHDIGKLAIPDRILHKTGTFTESEWRIMQTHTSAGHRMLSGSGEELLELAATLAWTHHERLDGSGYPRGLRGTDAPESGRILAVADTFDALTSDRPYRPAYTVERAVEQLLSLRSARLDPEMVDALLASLADEPFVALPPPDASVSGELVAPRAAA
jgi:putative two-component system response regulator